MQRVGGTPLQMYSLNYVQSIPNCVGELSFWLKSGNDWRNNPPKV